MQQNTPAQHILNKRIILSNYTKTNGRKASRSTIKAKINIVQNILHQQARASC
jgi:hypothetical protein